MLKKYKLYYYTHPTYRGTFASKDKAKIDEVKYILEQLKKHNFKNNVGLELFCEDKYVLRLVKKSRAKKTLITYFIMGNILGYPTCCIKKFIKENRRPYTSNFKKPSIIIRRFPFIQWHACSDKCIESIKFNERMGNLINEYFPEIYQHLIVS